MNLLDVLLLVGYGVGTALHGILLWLVIQRRRKRHSETVFLFLVAAGAAWFLGNTISRLGAVLLREPSVLVGRLADVICAVGLAFIPSLLLHTAFLFWSEVREPGGRRLRQIFTATIYLPALSLAPFLFNLIDLPGLGGEPQTLLSLGNTSIGKLYLTWLSVSFLEVAVISARLSVSVEDSQERRFYRIIAYVLSLVPVFVLAFQVFLRGRTGALEDLPEIVLTYTSIFPGVVMAYYIYRYNYMEFILRRSIFHGIVTLGLICLYYFFFRLIGGYLGRTPLRATAIEAILFIVLVYLFPYFRERLGKLLRSLFYTEVVDAEDTIQSLERDLAADSLINLDELLWFVIRGVKDATGVNVAAIVIVREGHARQAGDRLPLRGGSLPEMVRLFADGTANALDRHELTNLAVIEEMKGIGAEYAFPLRFQHETAGIIVLGRPRGRLPLSAETVDELIVLANHLGRAMERAELISEKLAWERRLYENERMSSLGRLSASVAHEVKNPLGSIKAIAQVMREELGESDSRREDLGLIISEVDRLAKVVNQLLRFARPQPDSTDRAEVREVVETVVQVQTPEIRKAGVSIKQRFPDGECVTAIGEDSLKEVLFNLIQNAVHAMPEGGTLEIACEISEDEGVLNLIVTDTGAGIPEDARDKVFEAFFTTKQNGTGLGLTIVRNRVEAAGGRISVRSRPGETVFTVSLPLARVAAPEGAVDEAASQNADGEPNA
ncbi:MAG TPA: ATP-binding protein [Candidatus Brocadiia bacterium]|nr:ATP-binding protein [Candidatus Brocadiia bacterium]